MYTVQAEKIVSDYQNVPSLRDFLEGLKVRIISKKQNELEFDLMNAHASIANAIRRILISEVATMALHDVKIFANETVFPNEYLAHRLGLVPIVADASKFSYAREEGNEENSLFFKVSVHNATSEVMNLTSKDILWVPLEGQADLRVTIPDGVLICKLVPGNRLEMELIAKKGRGEMHAKWSPVSLCSYKLMPRIELTREYSGDEALRLQACFSPGVIEIINNKAVVSNPRLEAMTREVFRHPELADGVKVMREPNWFCFTVESIWEDPVLLLRRALSILREKCENMRSEVSKLNLGLP